MTRRTTMRAGMAALTCLMASQALAQSLQPLEVPALVNTYRVLPDLTAAGPARDGLAVGTVNLSAREVREMYFESYVAGYHQGEPAGPTGDGKAANGQGYSVLARVLPAEERMPRMPITASPGPDGQIGTADDEFLLHIRIEKLPTRAACQKIVNHMVNMGLLPGDPSDGLDPDEDADPVATGRWRVLVHLPRGEAAPPAPSLFYPEAIRRITPMSPNSTTGSDDPGLTFRAGGFPTSIYWNFWGNLRVRYTQWDNWVRPIYTGAAPDVDLCRQDADRDFGIVPVPRMIWDPVGFITGAEGAGLSRTTAAGRDVLRHPSGAVGTTFFDASAMWENRLLDPDAQAPAQNISPLPQTDPDSDPSLVAGDLQPGSAASPGRWRRYDRALTDNNRPIEFVVHALDDRGPDGVPGNGDDAWVTEAQLKAYKDGQADPLAVNNDNNQWFLPGVNTTGPARGGQAGTVDPAADPYLVEGPVPASLPSPMPDFMVLPQPIDITVPLNLEGRVLRPGLGMVELQFEYETFVPANLPSSTAWNPDPTDAELLALRPGTGGPYSLPYNRQGYATATTASGLGAFGPPGNRPQYVRDPLDIVRTEEVRRPGDSLTDYDTEKGNWWRIRRYSGWPYNPLLIDRPNPSNAVDYQGGPIVCRFMVSPVAVVPEEQRTESVDDPNLATLASYAPTGGRYYPQYQVFQAGLRELERANYLLGYRADIPQAREADPLAGPQQDYFLPIRPGASSEAHRFFVRTVLDHQPGGSFHMWTDPAHCSQSVASSFGLAGTTAAGNVPGSGYALRGATDLANYAGDNAYRPRFLAYNLDPTAVAGRAYQPQDVRAAAAAVQASALMYAYDLKGYYLSGYTAGTAVHTERGVGDLDNFAMADVRKAFDNHVPTPLPRAAGSQFPDNFVEVPAYYDRPGTTNAGPYSVGQVFSAPAMLNRLEVVGQTTTWRVQKLVLDGTVTTTSATPGALVWRDLETAGQALDAFTLVFNLGGRDAAELLYGVRAVNTSTAAPTQELYELRIVARAGLGGKVLQAPNSTRQGPDPQIGPQPLPEASVRIAEVQDAEIRSTGDNVSALSLKIDVPRYQPPSADAVERQVLVDHGQPPGGYTTVVQPARPDRSGSAPWDRYQGSAATYVDDGQATVRTLYTPTALIASDAGIAGQFGLVFPTAGTWDVRLYRVRARPAGSGGAPPADDNFDRPAITQFVAWYEEDRGWVGADGAVPTAAGGSVAAARLLGRADDQGVSIEPYATFDYEFSVAYDRRLRIAEKLVDFGKVIHGGVSQWVPITVINEGNVPLRQVKLYLDFPLTNVALDDRATMARLAQTQPVPSWFAQDFAVMAQEGTAETSTGSGALTIAPPAVGASDGRRAGDVFLRVGRLSPTTPTDDRRIPVGQPVGNYIGRVRAFVDDLGLPGADTPAIPGDGTDRPDSADETALGGSAVMKLTVQESPLWRIDNFYDNEIDRRSDRAAGDLSPYDPNRNGGANPGTFQPIPAFNQLYTNPNTPQATPTVVVVQDPADFTNNTPPDPPNGGDSLWIGWSSLRSLSGGVNWGVYYRDAARPTFLTGPQILQTNYRAFRWPDLAATLVSDDDGTQRCLYPNVCPVPLSSTGSPREFVLVWHSERQASGRRASFLQFRRLQVGAAPGPNLQIPDDGSGNAQVTKQVPRAFVDDSSGAQVLWCAWQSGETGQARLGFNAIQMPASYTAAAGYADAIAQTANKFVNYPLQTPAGLTNVMEPYVLPSRRDDQTLSSPLSAVNVLYSGWSPLWQNQDIYWSRYKPLEDPGAAPLDTPAGQLRYSPMGDDSYRLNTLAAHPTTGNPAYWVRLLPGGRMPFPRVRNELLQTNANHTVYAGGSIDWVMPPDQFRRSEPDGAGGWRVGNFVHRGFADAEQPLFDADQYAALAGGTVDADLDPLVVLRVYRAPQAGATPTAAELAAPPLTSAQAATQAGRVDFDLDRALFDRSSGEWVLPVRPRTGVPPNLDGSGLLLARGIDVVRIHPGLGRVTFNRPLYRRGTDAPLYVYATYRPCAWRVTTDEAVDSQPSAAFDWWERMLIVWRRTVEGGKGQLWYRTFSLAAPLAKAPVTTLRAVVNDRDSNGDLAFNGTSPTAADAALGNWSIVTETGAGLRGTGPYSTLGQTTSQGFTLATIPGSTTAIASPGQYAGWNEAATLRFSFQDIGRTVRVWYDSGDPGVTNPVEEALQVPGLGPERMLPLDGAVNESQPAVAAEHFYVGYARGATIDRIMSSRFWLAWISSRELYTLPATVGASPNLGTSGSNVFYAAFMPDFSPGTEAR